MEYTTLELNLTSAKDLQDVNLFSKMDVYAVVSLFGGGEPQKTKTPVDRDSGKNPTWNFPMKFTVNESLARQNRLSLEIQLRCKSALGGDKDIGKVHVPVKELLEQTGNGKSFQHVSYQVRKPSGKPKGSLNFSYKFGEKVAAPAKAPLHKEEPVVAYPPPVAGSSSMPYAAPAHPPPPHSTAYPPPPQSTAYPPPPSQHAGGYEYPPPPQAAYGGYPQVQPGYGYPPQTGYGYGYPPQQQGYGYPPQVQKPAKNKFGMGLGAGLLGGALGGLLIGDMVSDVGSYDAGFDDAGGFDF